MASLTKQKHKNKQTQNSMNNELDPLAMPAGDLAEPSFPVLAEGVKRMVIRGLEEKAGESKTDGKPYKQLVITLATTKDDTSSEGQPLSTGFAFNASIFLTPNERNTAKQIAEQAAMPVKAALGKTTKVQMRDCVNDPSILVGKIVDVKIGIRKGKDGYGDSNVVKSWIIPA